MPQPNGKRVPRRINAPHPSDWPYPSARMHSRRVRDHCGEVKHAIRNALSDASRDHDTAHGSPLGRRWAVASPSTNRYSRSTSSMIAMVDVLTDPVGRPDQARRWSGYGGSAGRLLAAPDLRDNLHSRAISVVNDEFFAGCTQCSGGARRKTGSAVRSGLP